MQKFKEFFTPSVRRYLYVVGLSLVTLLVGYGILSEEHILLWNIFLAALLGMAIGNVPGTPDDQDQLNLKKKG